MSTKTASIQHRTLPRSARSPRLALLSRCAPHLLQQYAGPHLRRCAPRPGCSEAARAGSCAVRAAAPRRLYVCASGFATGVGSSSDVDAQPQQGAAAPEVVLEHERPVLQPPTPLPPPPAAEGLPHVLLYSFRICLTERWALPRLAAVFGLLAVSRIAGFTMPLYFKRAVDAAGRGSAPGARQALLLALAMAGACRMLSGVAHGLQQPIFALVSHAAGRRMSYYGLLHVLKLGTAFHSASSMGRLVRMVERGTKSISAMCRAIVFRLVPTSLEIVAVCSVLTRMFRPEVGAIVAVTSLAYVAFTAAMTQAAVAGKQRVKRFDNEINAQLLETLFNIEPVQLLGAQRREAAAFDSLLQGFQDAAVRFEYITGLLTSIQAVILGVGMTAAMLTVAVHSGTAGDLVLVQGMLAQLWAPLISVGGLYRRLRKSLVDLEDFIHVLRQQPSVREGRLDSLPDWPPQAAVPAQHIGGNGAEPAGLPTEIATDDSAAMHASYSQPWGSPHDAAPAKNSSSPTAASRRSPCGGSRQSEAGSGSGAGLHLEFRDVCFSYSRPHDPGGEVGSLAAGSAAPAADAGSRRRETLMQLQRVSFTVQPGEAIGIVGPPGCGKSTVLRLIMRLYDAQSGSVLLNGLDVRELTHAALKGAVAAVPQYVNLVNGSVAANIAFGLEGADEATVQQAAALAGVDAAVAQLEHGYATQVGERGQKVSGGEKQRIAIARALVRRPRLLLCDEATSSLDRSAEKLALSSILVPGRRERTTIVVAHRLQTVAACDRIMVMAGGCIVAVGTHTELLARPGWYADTWAAQHAVSPAAMTVGAAKH